MRRFLWVVWSIAFLAGSAGIVQRLATGHEMAGYGSYVSWGLWVALYIYFIGLSAGAFLLSSLVYVFGVKQVEPIGKLALFVALVSLVAALLSIWLDLGHMSRFWRVYTAGAFSSMMAWMVWLYTVYFLVLLAEFWYALRPDLVRVAQRQDAMGRLARALTVGFAMVSPARVAVGLGVSAGVFLLWSQVYASGADAAGPVSTLLLVVAAASLIAVLGSVASRLWQAYREAPRSPARVTALKVEKPVDARAVAATDLSAGRLEHDARMLRVLGTIGVPLAIAFHGGVGALFGVVGARPFWYSALFPLLFLVSALTSGGALLTFVVAAFWPRKDEEWRMLVTSLGRLTLALLLLDLLMEWAEFSINLWASLPAHVEAYKLVLFGPYWWVFWIVHLLIGAAIPLVLLVLRPRSPGWVGVAGLLMVVGFLGVRLNIIIPGLAVPELRGLERAFVDHRLTFGYFPSLMEWQVAVFVASLAVLLFAVGYRLLPIVPAQPKEV